MSHTYLMTVSTECEEGHEEEFNRWYDEVHVPQLLTVPGVVSVERYEVDGDAYENRWLATYKLDRDPATVRATMATMSFDFPPSYLRSKTVTRLYRQLQ